MNLTNLISFRKKLQDIEITSYGFKGFYHIATPDDVRLISNFQENEIREIYHNKTKNTADPKNLQKGDEIIIAVDGSKFPAYYETLKDFISFNKSDLRYEDFYIAEIDYHHENTVENKEIENYLLIQKIIAFLKELSTYDKYTNGTLELFFNKPDKVCSIVVEYDLTDIKNLKIQNSIVELQEHVFEKSDQEARRKLFSNEMINLLSVQGFSFKNVLENWDAIHNSYKSSFQIYLSEFSFDKIKTSSQEYFHELTDRIYSTINKFSTYILAIPVAYILILRFFSFDAKNFAKDSFLMVIGVLYFIIIWFVLLNNLSKAFKTIEKDIAKFISRIKNEVHLHEITESLNTQKKKLIPSQKRKISLVRLITLLILIMTIGAYYHIYSDRLIFLVENVELKIWDDPIKEE